MTSAQARRSAAPLAGAVVITLAALLVAAIGLTVDNSSITAAPAWLKPAKFAVSITVYCATVAWLIRQVRGHPRLLHAVSWGTATALVGELALIDLQVVRGTSSHFNTATTFDAAVYATMGGLVAVVFAVAVMLAVVLARAASLDALTRTGAVAAVLVSLLGMLEALTMIAHGGHTVGAADSGDRHRMWVTGWSLDHGDLRVGHFVGLHGLQAILVSGWWLRHHRRDDECAARALAIISIGYAGVVVLLTWQAELGRPLQRPGPILGVAGLVVVVITGTAAAHTRRPATTPVRAVGRCVDELRSMAPHASEPAPCR